MLPQPYAAVRFCLHFQSNTTETALFKMVSEQNCDCEYYRNIKLKNNNLGTTSLAILNPQAGQSKERWSPFFQRLKFFFLTSQQSSPLEAVFHPHCKLVEEQNACLAVQ